MMISESQTYIFFVASLLRLLWAVAISHQAKIPQNMSSKNIDFHLVRVILRKS